MKPKNVMLLGFVNKAVEYLDKHMDEEPDKRLAELKNIDLASIRDELNDHLDASLGTMQSTMSTLLKAGNEAFDEFIDATQNRNSISDQLGKIFDVDLDEDNNSKQEELIKLLSFYNLEDDYADDEAQEIGLQVDEVEETNDEEDEYLTEIRKNASTNDDTQEITPIEHDVTDELEIDEIFSEIVNNEDNNMVEEGNDQPVIEESVIEQEVVVDEEGATEQESVTEQEPVVEQVEEIEYEDPILHIIENPAIEAVIDDMLNTNDEDIDDVENETDIVKDTTNAVEETYVVEGESTDNDNYINSLIDDLREQLTKEEEDKKNAENKNKEIYERISSIYPHIPQGFIRSVYELKDSLSYDYPIDQKLIVLHRVLFKDVENLRKFVEIGLSHEYTINADENKMIVDIFKEFVNSDGKILTNIYEVANQGYLLDGSYEGYNVIVQED